jgi:sulfite reductase (ferredoxin)
VDELTLDVEDLERFMGRFSLGRDSDPLPTTSSPHFLRIKIPGGFLTSHQLLRIAEMAKSYSRGQVEITNRQDIQLHWIEAEQAVTLFTIMDDLGFTTDMCGQGFSGARYGDPRNIVCCPVSGIDQNELVNGTPLLHKLSEFLIGNPAFQDMPRKFKFAISGCGCDCTRAVTNDLAFVAVRQDERVGFTVLAGGSVGSSLPGPRLAQPLGIFIPSEEAYDVAIASIKLHREYSSRESKAKARFKWLFHSWGRDKFVQALSDKLGNQFDSYTGPSFSRGGVHEGIQPQKQAGFSYLHLPILGGSLSSEDLTNLAHIAETYGNGELRLTPTQNIIIPYITQQMQCLNAITKLGFSVTGAPMYWNSMGCASNFCGKTMTPHAKELCAQLIHRLETRFSHELLEEAGLRIHVSGCYNNCCANVISEIGLAGRLIRTDSAMNQCYHILLGGSYGLTAHQGTVIQENVPVENVVPMLEQLVYHYSQKKTAHETLHKFCLRHSPLELQNFLRPSGGH